MNIIRCCERALAKMAVRALYFEVKAYPKPGLVSFVDAGAHHDMNGETFYRSLFTLRHYFYQITKMGLIHDSFEELKQVAIEAERRMFEKTRGINTHRGAIFALGIICISVMRLAQEKRQFTPMDVHRQILTDWPKYLANHLENPESHGALVRRKYKVIDAKQMAMQGYQLIFQLLPAFISLFIETKSLDTVCLFAYLELLLRMDDTNILHRKGKSGLDYAKCKAAELLAIRCVQTRQTKALELHQHFSELGISPGGVADLISVLLFLGQLFCKQLFNYSDFKKF
ncbi:triphosphoribosyl-dephospho-CoA synthase [Legionella qingyii]|uniref:triphosphoribosyl-dephospho-CoA synthase n=1 Tax=Legionella qingyii TaxID=2184757 RepID=A0A317U1S1_9GAMM|nr:triphosphoribosyl-dephospho-CoA synthase MdcB [Legionella qingyii]PWY55175.1 triphosphoribosyl-dephospho-CoA synthase [Legionella qingyii]RUR25403.1 triphosphoribosyl-dephospho-CoA synthase [Legionella qingyii]RUR28486.1 triphosphoribosyl-dephospho-CoA synthase [Legionella qingyii]